MRNYLPLALSALILTGCATTRFKAEEAFYDPKLEAVVNSEDSSVLEFRDAVRAELDNLGIKYKKKLHCFYIEEGKPKLTEEERVRFDNLRLKVDICVSIMYQ
ncbi:MAG: hypothetical protein WCK90_02555 [archaeon]